MVNNETTLQVNIQYAEKLTTVAMLLQHGHTQSYMTHVSTCLNM